MIDFRSDYFICVKLFTINPLRADHDNSQLYLLYYQIKASILGMILAFNPFKPEFTIVIFIHYKPRIAVAILDL